MDKKKIKVLKSKGYKIGSVEDFLGRIGIHRAKTGTQRSSDKSPKKKQFDTGTVSQNAEIQSVKGRQNGKRRSERIRRPACQIASGHGS